MVLATGTNKTQVQDSKGRLLEPKEIATKFNRFFATTGTKIAGQLPPADTDVWKKYKPVRQCDDRESWDLELVRYKTVKEILYSLRMNKNALKSGV